MAVQVKTAASFAGKYRRLWAWPNGDDVALLERKTFLHIEVPFQDDGIPLLYVLGALAVRWSYGIHESPHLPVVAFRLWPYCIDSI